MTKEEILILILAILVGFLLGELRKMEWTVQEKAEQKQIPNYFCMHNKTAITLTP